MTLAYLPKGAHLCTLTNTLWTFHAMYPWHQVQMSSE